MWDKKPWAAFVAWIVLTMSAMQERLKSRPPTGPAFDSLVDVSASRDVVVRSYAA
jgi:hypothetical protein